MQNAVKGVSGLVSDGVRLTRSWVRESWGEKGLVTPAKARAAMRSGKRREDQDPAPYHDPTAPPEKTSILNGGDRADYGATQRRSAAGSS
jgi:hypothetical protein